MYVIPPVSPSFFSISYYFSLKSLTAACCPFHCFSSHSQQPYSPIVHPVRLAKPFVRTLFLYHLNISCYAYPSCTAMPVGITYRLRIGPKEGDCRHRFVHRCRSGRFNSRQRMGQPGKEILESAGRDRYDL